MFTSCYRESLEAFDHLCETFPDENCVLTSREILVEVSTAHVLLHLNVVTKQA